MRLGVSMQAIEDTLYDAFGQRQISTIFGQANQYRVVLEADPVWQADPYSLRLLRVPATHAQRRRRRRLVAPDRRRIARAGAAIGVATYADCALIVPTRSSSPRSP